LFEVFSDKKSRDEEGVPLSVQSETPPADAGRRERQAPARRLRPPATPYFHAARSEAKHGGAVEGPVSKQSPSTVGLAGKILHKKSGVYDG
jgi:hypothetical protein